MAEGSASVGRLVLSGPGVEISFDASAGELELKGQVFGDQYERTFAELAPEESAHGPLVRANLLVTRAGWEIDLNLWLPEVEFPEGEDEVPVSAVALATRDRQAARVFQGDPQPRRDYDARQLHGTAIRASG